MNFREDVNNKKTPIEIVIRILLYLSMCYSAIASSITTYNLLPFYDYSSYGVTDFSLFYGSSSFILPFILGLIFYGLYCLWINIVFNNVNVRMRLFNLGIRKNSLRRRVDVVFIALCIALGSLDLILMYYPLLSRILSTSLKLIFASLALVWTYFRIMKGLDKKYGPIIVSALLWPSIIMVVLL